MIGPNRTDVAAELRKLADIIEANPDFPINRYGFSVGQALQSVDEVRRVGELLGLTATVTPRDDGGTSWLIYKYGALSMGWSYIEDAPEQPMDITQGEGKVGASSAVEAPTAPGDGHVYECCGKVGRISRHNDWCETGPALGGAA